MGMMFDVPPLRDRSEDIVPLVDAFILEFNPKRGEGVTGITPAAFTRLPVYTSLRCRISCQGPVIANVIPGL